MKLTGPRLADNKRFTRKKPFNTALHTKQITLSCDECAHSWETVRKPRKLKQGVLVVTDICPACQEVISEVL